MEQAPRTEAVAATATSADARLEPLLAVIPDIVVTLSSDGRLLSCSPASLPLLGFAPEELVGRRLDELPALDGEGLAVAAREVRAVLDGTRTGAVLVPVVHRNGSRRWFEVRAGVGRESDGSTVLRAILRDTTERHVAEQRLRAIVESTNDIILIMDATGVIRFENAAVERILGFVPGERVGRSVLDYVHPDDHATATARLADIQAPDATTAVTVRFRHKSGAWRTLETYGRNMLHVSEVSGILGVARDITERLRLQERLEAAERLDSIGRLAGGIAHDFNNLLAVVLASAEDLRQSPAFDTDTQHGLSLIIDAAERARDLTARLLAFARRQPSDRIGVVDVASVLESMAPLLRRLLGEACSLAIETDGRRPVVPMSPPHFEQVVLNLAANARDAMPEGGALRIALAVLEGDAVRDCAEPRLGDRSAVRLRVTDSGGGMTPEVVAQAFEPFYSTKDVGKGTGLGLSLVHGIVRSVGGDIRIESEPGRGTVVDVCLPMTEERSAEPTAGPGVPVRRGHETILVVEDNPDIRSLTSKTLSQVGYSVREATSGLEALTALASGDQIALVVTDVIMPEMTGVALVQELRRRHARLPVLFITGDAPEHVLERQVLDARTALLAKPFNREVLLSRVREMLDVAST